MADEFIKIPMPGRVESLNASVAAGILMYEPLRQKLMNYNIFSLSNFFRYMFYIASKDASASVNENSCFCKFRYFCQRAVYIIHFK